MQVEYLDHMGDDLAVVNAARVSFDKESEWIKDICDCDSDAHDNCELCMCKNAWYLSEADTKLIKYLAKHNHWTPFSHTAIKLRMSAPVPIRTQCFKHKQGFVENEESRRYISSRPELFVPEYFRSKPEGSIKQGSGGKHTKNNELMLEYRHNAHKAIDLYEYMINEGVAPEQARFVLPQGVIVNWIWTGNVYSFANFYNKRSESHAQKEIQDLAKMVDEIIRPLYPVSWSALVDKEN